MGRRKMAKVDKLSQDCNEAMVAGYGCHYGRYKASCWDGTIPVKNEEILLPDRHAAYDLKKCQNCGCEFYPTQSAQKHCCVKCRQQAYYKDIRDGKREVVTRLTEAPVPDMKMKLGSTSQKYYDIGQRIIKSGKDIVEVIFSQKTLDPKHVKVCIYQFFLRYKLHKQYGVFLVQNRVFVKRLEEKQ